MKLLIFSILFSFIATAQNQNDFKNDLEILDSSISFNDRNGYHTISVIGNISNKSKKLYSDLFVEVKFFDSNSTLIDTFTNELYSNVFPAHDKVSFKLQGAAAKPKAMYSTHKIRIIEAEIKQPCKSTTGFRKFLADWGGFIFVAIFVLYMGFAAVNYQESLKQDKLYKQKFMDIADYQTKQSEEIIKLLEKMANINNE